MFIKLLDVGIYLSNSSDITREAVMKTSSRIADLLLFDPLPVLMIADYQTQTRD